MSENKQFESKQIYYSLPNPNIQNETKSLKKTSSKSLQPLKQTKKIAIVTDFDNTITARHLYWFLNQKEGESPFQTFFSKLDVNDQNKIKKEFNDKIEFKPENINRIRTRKGKYLNLYDKMKKMENLLEPEKEDLEELIFGGKERFDLLEKFLKDLYNLKVDIYISSRGKCTEIEYVLNQLKLKKYFQNKINCTEEDEINKDDFINTLFENYNYNYDYIIYIDDDPKYKDKPYNGKLFYFGDEIYSNENGKMEIVESDFGLSREKNGLTKEMMNTIITKIEELKGSKKKLNPVSE
jgi:phosphoglycolate phosphatase-like HAD superfamily hydrolase